jgi:endoglucanase
MGNYDMISRRGYLAAGVVGLSALAGCPGGNATDTPASGDGGGGDGSADDGSDGSGGEADGGSDGDGDSSDGGDGGDDSDGSESDGGDGEETPSEATPDDGRYSGDAVLVDQVGYRPGDEKRAVVRADAESFAVHDAESGTEVASGDLSDPVTDGASGDTVRYAAFDDLSESGEYVVSAGGVESASFAVGEGVWGRTLAEVGRRYTLRRANTAIDDPVTGLSLEPGHPQDREARIYFADEFHDEGDRLDVHGGWYDAGDYGKYVPPAAVTVGHLLLAYERHPDTFEVGQFAMPDGVSQAEREAGLPDLLAEVKFELEWFERMQRPDGALYHKVAGQQWPGMNVRPAEDTQTRYVFGLSTYGTAMAVGAFAMAARIYRSFDGGFADRMLENAVAGYEYLRDNPDAYFRSDEGQNGGSGAYRQDTDRTERFWAAAELLKTTGESRYAEYIDAELADQVSSPARHAGWGDANLFGKWAYYTADAGSDAYRETVAGELTAAADELVAHVGEQGYNISLGLSDYFWGSNSLALGNGSLCLLADTVESNADYRAAARDQVHYVLGRTPTDRGYVTGSGERPPENPHSRPVASTGINVPGNVVGGPNNDGGDPDLDSFLASEDPAPAKSYLDVQGSYASNEPALDYAAPLVPLLAAFTPADAVGVE